MRAVNLIPSDDRRGVGGVGVGRSQGAAYAVLGLLAGLAALALIYGLARHQISTRRSELASITARAQRAQASASVLAPYTSFIALREARVQAVEQLVDSRFDWAHALHELGRVMPSDASITSFVGSVGTGTSGGSSAGAAGGSSTAKSSSASTSATVSSSTPPGSVPTFTLGGCATSQAEVAVTLQRLRLIDGVGNVTLQSSSKSGAASAGSSSCGGGPAFTVQLTFDPLPSVPGTVKSGAELTSSTTSSTGGER